MGVRPVRIGYISKWGVQKNFDVLFAAIKRCTAAGRDVRLVLTLDPTLAENVRLLARAKAKPLAAARTEIRRPARPATLDGSAARNPTLELGRIERPNAQWVLLRGSEEAATFRLAIDALRLQEPGARAAEWGPVGAHRPEASRAGVPPSRGLAFRDLGLQRFAAEPLLDPVICQFGSARGGQWGSQT